jgi:hypothetical protein
MSNQVTLFSNGIGHFRRSFEVKAGMPKSISIPFNKTHIGDVAASLQVFGAVKLLSPPSFTPANSNSTSLVIDQNNALVSLLTKLSGCKVRIPALAEGRTMTLVGIHPADRRTSDGLVKEYMIVFEREGVLYHKPTYSIDGLEFLEDAVKIEVQKALRANFEKIKPDSTFLELELGAVEAADAIVQYTIPVAAWKMRYAIRQDKKGFSFDGAAIIDNNTDEEWDSFYISVVTGNPVSFSTDIAQVVMPERKFVSVVEGQVLGNVDVEAGRLDIAGTAYRGGTKAIRACAVTPSSYESSPKFSHSNRVGFGLADDAQSLQQMASGDANNIFYESAEAAEVEAKEVGDFCVFTAKEPITISAHKSAVVPMFGVTLPSAGLVLLYKASHHPRRPYRAVKFKNETEYSLGRGKTTIYNEGVFSGECMLETTKPGENRTLPHCLENGVKVVKEIESDEASDKSVSISKGIMIQESVQTTITTYTIESFKDEAFKIALEHENVLGMQDVITTVDLKVKDSEKLTKGYRYYFELPARGKLVLKVTEQRIDRMDIVLTSGIFGQHYTAVLHKCGPITKDPVVKECVKLQNQINELNEREQEFKGQLTELSSRVDRVRANLQAAGSIASKAAEGWIADLDASEKEIRKIEKEELPGLRTHRKAVQADLNKEIKKIVVSWENKRK